MILISYVLHSFIRSLSQLHSLTMIHWVVVQIFFMFTPNFGEDKPILRSIFFKGVGSTTNQFTIIHHSPQFDDVAPQRFEIGQRLLRAYAWRLVEGSAGFLLLGSGTRKKPRLCRFWNGRPQHIDFSLYWGPKSDVLLNRIVYTKSKLAFTIFRWYAFLFFYAPSTGSQKMPMVWFMLSAQCSVAMCLHDVLSGNHYHDNSRSVSTDLPATWPAHGCSWQWWLKLAVYFWVVVSNIFFMFIPAWGNDPIWLIFFKWLETHQPDCILYVCLIFIYAHEFNMEGRCIEFDTVNVCVWP